MSEGSEACKGLSHYACIEEVRESLCSWVRQAEVDTGQLTTANYTTDADRKTVTMYHEAGRP